MAVVIYLFFYFHFVMSCFDQHVNRPSSSSHLRCSSFVPYVGGQTPGLQETPLCRTHQLSLQDGTNGLEWGKKHSASMEVVNQFICTQNTQVLVHWC